MWGTSPPLRVWEWSRPASPGLCALLVWGIGNQAGDGCSGVPNSTSRAGRPSGPAPWMEGICLPGSSPALGVTPKHPSQGWVIPVVQASGSGQECGLEGGPEGRAE